ncbi:MAG TPA: O-antigen ligase family protein [Acidimicrobiales bacterium]|nr:O-antigen ligase family protein [Acidimicrobiales bacterium]
MGESDESAPRPEATRPDGDLIGLLGVAVCGLLPLVVLQNLYWGAWAPKAALCLVLLFPGLVVLARLVAARSPAAVAATAFLAAAAVSTALSDRPAQSLVGPANWGTGWLLLAAAAAAWAVGVVAGDRRRRELVVVLMAVTVVNAGVAWLQARTDVGRTRGLMGNAVFLGGLAAGGLFLLARRLGRERGSWWWVPAIALVAGAVQLSGGRAATVLAVVAVLASLPGAGAARSAVVVGAVILGVAVAPVGAKGVVLGSTRSAPSAVATAASGDTRVALWRISAGAVAERPVVGYGPGRFAAATGRRYTPAAAQEHVVLRDAHNWVVGTAVTTGLLGLGLLLAWLTLAARGARGPLAGFAVIVAVSSLVQPLHVALTPMAMLALGAAGGDAVRRRARPLPVPVLRGAWGVAGLAGLAVGIAGAVVLVTGQAVLQRGVAGDSQAQVRLARTLSPPWPDLLLKAASVEATYGIREGEPHKQRTLELTRRAALLDPTDPILWSELGFVEAQWGTTDRAAAAFRRGLEANPWDVSSLEGSADLARARGDVALLREDCRRLRILKVPVQACGARPSG